MHQHRTADPDTEGVLIRWSRPYDAVFRRFIRRTDSPILTLAEVTDGDSVLDVATGPGYLARAAALLVRTTGRAVGIDAAPEMIAQAKRRAEAESSAAEFLVAGAQCLPFDDGSFDAVVARLAMHHLPGGIKTRAVAEMVRVLKPGGFLVIADVETASAVELLHDVATVVSTGSLGILLRYVKASKPRT
jgi:ubiquinone/menaquinone biosynthesis C-methylase UbiE